LQEKSKDAERFLQRVGALERREEAETSERARAEAEEVRTLREGRVRLEERLGVITREYEQLVTQL
jgi:hypothetical protein